MVGIPVGASVGKEVGGMVGFLVLMLFFVDMDNFVEIEDDFLDIEEEIADMDEDFIDMGDFDDILLFMELFDFSLFFFILRKRWPGSVLDATGSIARNERVATRTIKDVFMLQ